MERAISSARLAIEHFNRPYEEGRREAVLHFALHAHEMLMKAVLLQRGKSIQRRRESKSISVATALRMLGNQGEKVLTESETLSLTAVSNVRDAAQHSVVMLSEQTLYLQTQTAVTVFDKVLKQEFDVSLADFLPSRVLPVSTDPPTSLELLIDTEVSQVKALLEPGRRKTAEAKARLRPLLAIDLAAAGEERTATPLEVDRATNRLKQGRPWREVMPNLASLTLDASGTGQTYNVRLAKAKDAPPVKFAETEDEAESAAIIREVDNEQRYPFALTDLARLASLTAPQATAFVWKLGLKSDEKCCHTFQHGKSRFPRYSHEALSRMREAAAKFSPVEVWRQYRRQRQQDPGHEGQL
ncbi:DUF3644 domain-containing protein [Candidatus Cryosericum septentrionale]|uniref:DUF3644 domain-containing protein n=1 Tax=Candidatus Cryosericum septentrionale TaxID=2290913 RepID=UPI001A9F20B4|nr:DUF3644 domain-containing protein [Candidatus Cryosericum septentrionale]